MTVRLYWMSLSHPSQAVRKMLDIKSAPYELVNVLPLNQRLHLRLVGFRGGTVPALKLDGRRVQGSRAIAKALDELWPEPPLFPRDPVRRRQVEDAERWGEQQLQPIPRRIARYGAISNTDLRSSVARIAHLPAPDTVARVIVPAVRYYARTIEADGRRATEAGVRADLEALPSLLDHIDKLTAEGILTTDPPNAGTLQVFSSLCLLDALTDFHEVIGERPCVKTARDLFPDYPSGLPRFLPPEWLLPLRQAQG